MSEGVRERVERAAEAVSPAWPLHSFVTANPLGGFEDRPFEAAVAAGAELFGGRGYPDPETFRAASERGAIDPGRLRARLDAAGYDLAPEEALAKLETDDGTAGGEDAHEAVDRVVSRWLAAFCDEGAADWPMPDREAGLYAAVRTLVPHEPAVPGDQPLPEDPITAVEAALSEVPERRWEAVFRSQLVALPGWTRFLKRRAEDGGEDPWADTHPAPLVEYLAVRLAVADRLDLPLDPGPTDGEEAAADGPNDRPLAAVLLEAWEASYRAELVEALAEAEPEPAGEPDRPAAQLVFCIDTRSERIRAAVEGAGPYETHGYAGFFGVPLRWTGYEDERSHDACPPVVEPAHRVGETPVPDAADRRAKRDRLTRLREAGANLVHAVKHNAATAFSFVETTGPAYGLGLAARTLLPERVHDAAAALDRRSPEPQAFCEPTIEPGEEEPGSLPAGMTLEERVEYAATAVELMGWEQFGRLVVFVGHASRSANNPFASSLDCGACAGNPGGPNARVLAAICNDPRVRERLCERGVDVPEDTYFLAGEHDTTTGAVRLFDADVPDSHREDVARLRADLQEAQRTVATERTDETGAAAVRELRRRTVDWAETRPEWGLAGNAAFVVGPRSLTADLDLDGRAFLHSYDPATDPDGEALAAILAGPMVVTQWINAQYYFATVDSGVYGSGSKTTHNPVGNAAVYQGNGGDVLTGLPEQSVLAAADKPYHQPVRLTTVVYAPRERVTELLRDNDDVRGLLDNGWLHLSVLDPERDEVFHYDGALSWTRHGEPEAAADRAVEQVVGED